MITNIKDSKYDIRIEPSDWRWSATIVGLCKYFNYIYRDDNLENIFYVNEECMEFNSEYVIEENYLRFVEKHFNSGMHHIILKRMLNGIEDNTDDKEFIKEVNEKLKANTIMKKIFKVKYDGKNKNEILDLIDKNDIEIIRNTYINGNSLYKNYCNETSFFKVDGKSCRLQGYSVDMGKKSKSVSYALNNATANFIDSKYFDFIPFAFSQNRESFFINCSANLIEMIGLNSIDYSVEKNYLRSEILLNTSESSEYINYDVEIIIKDREKDFYETLMMRKEAIKIFEKLSPNIKESLNYVCKVEKASGFSDTEYIGVSKIVTESILNNIKLDNLIEYLIKIGQKNYLIGNLIKVNELIYTGGKYMTEKQKVAYASAKQIKEKLKRENKVNKIRAYEQKLVSAVSLKDYDKVQEIMLHLSSYTQVSIGILPDLFEDFEANKNLAYTFINTLGEKNIENKEGDR